MVAVLRAAVIAHRSKLAVNMPAYLDHVRLGTVETDLLTEIAATAVV